MKEDQFQLCVEIFYGAFLVGKRIAFSPFYNTPLCPGVHLHVFELQTV